MILNEDKTKMIFLTQEMDGCLFQELRQLVAYDMLIGPAALNTFAPAEGTAKHARIT